MSRATSLLVAVAVVHGGSALLHSAGSPARGVRLACIPGSAPLTPSTALPGGGGHRWARAAVRMEEDASPKPIIKDANGKFKKSIASVNEQLSTIRVGRATSDMLDRVEVER